MGRSKTERPIEPCSGRRSRRIAIPTVVGLYLVATVLARRRGYGIGGNTDCPVGHHWTLVRPVRDSGLSDEER
jgi:hypothetical protein